MSVRGLLPAAARCLSVNLGQNRGGGCRVTELKLQKLEFRPIITAFRITIMPAPLYIEFSYLKDIELVLCYGDISI